MRSIRARLLATLLVLCALAVAGMAAGGYAVLRARARAQAREAFAGAHSVFERSLAARWRLLSLTARLSYEHPLIRLVTAGATDESDFGFGSPTSDVENLRKLHENLASADWDWSMAAGEGGLAVADYKGRVVYTSAAPEVWGRDATVLPAVAAALGKAGGGSGAMLAAASDPRLRDLGLVPAGATGLVVVLARAEVLRGRAQACFLQLIGADHLLADATLGAARVSLVGEDGRGVGDDGAVPPAAIAAAAAAAGSMAEARVDGATWVAQAYPLAGPAGGERIGWFVVAMDLGAALHAIIDPALAPLVEVALGLLVVALLLAAVLAGRFSRPIVSLEGAAQRVAGGDLDVAVAARGTGDELDRLGRAFNGMVEGLRERERVKHTFKKYLAPDVVDYLLAHPEAQELGGDRRELTVVFSDLVRFTAFAEARPPEEVVATLNRYFTRASERIAARGGVVNKYIGDAIMAIFGAPVPRPDHAARACLAALDHLEVLDELGGFAVRIGVSTGDMIVGNIGGGGAQDYTVIGDAVNLGQRVEGANRDYGTRLLCTEAVARAAGSAVDMREIDRVILPGRSQPTTLFEVLGPGGFLDDHPERRAAAARYAEGLAALRARRFAEAAAAFAAAVAVHPGDAAAATLRERAAAFLHTPPPDDWDGVHRTVTK